MSHVCFVHRVAYPSLEVRKLVLQICEPGIQLASIGIHWSNLEGRRVEKCESWELISFHVGERADSIHRS